MPAPNRKPTGNILLVWDRVGDYHAARFKALEELCSDTQIYIADLGGADGLYGWKNPLAGHPNYIALSTRGVEESDLFHRFQWFRNTVKANDIQIVGIAGYGRWEYRLMLTWCRLRRIRTILFAESWYGENRWVNQLKKGFLQWTCSGFLVSGKRALDHFRKKIGIRNKAFATGYSVVNNAHFDLADDVERERIILCVARFSPEKNLVRLIEAFQQSTLAKDWVLRIVGGGPQKEILHQKIADPAKVQLQDWLSYQALPYLYKQASFFILPSTFEPWGLVVNEAMAAGLPVAVSTECGCLPDLVDVRNGFKFNPYDTADITLILNQIAQLTPMEFELMGKRSYEIIRQFSPENWAERFRELARSHP